MLPPSRRTNKIILLAVIFIILGIGFVVFHRDEIYNSSKIEEQLKKSLNSINSTSPNADHKRNLTAENEAPEVDEFEQCETMEGKSAIAAGFDNGAGKRPPWCMYKEEVGLRIIVLTFNRHASLQKLLDSINSLELDGDSATVEIWIDRDRKKNTVDEQTVSTARKFRWRHGSVNVHVRSHHVGLYGQWIDTWRPRNASTSEMALILEDDLSLSPFAYRWLRAARRFYVGRRDDISGFTLQSEGLIVAAERGGSLTRPPADFGAAFLYALVGSWGYAPEPAPWIGFQNWFHKIRSEPGFHPHVPGLKMTRWYKNFEKRGTAHSMWTMWYLYYCAVVRQLYTVYNNIPVVAERLQLNTGSQRGYLCVNRRENGLHFFRKAQNNTNQLLTIWNDEFIKFNENAQVLSFEGKTIKGGGQPIHT